MKNAVLGKRIKQQRLVKKLTQSELAEKINSSQKQIWKYETGQNEPSSGVLLNIAMSLNISADYLLGLTDSPNRALQTENDLSNKEKAIIEAVRNKRLEDVVRIYIDIE